MVSPRAKYRDLGLAVFTVVGFFLPLGGVAMAGGFAIAPRHARAANVILPCLGAGLIALGLLAVLRVYRHTRRLGLARLRIAYETLVLAWFPLWGLLVNHFLLPQTCVETHSAPNPHRAFAEPWVAAPTLLHLTASLAFVLSRRRPERLRPLVETAVLAALLVGIALHITLQIQLGAEFVALGLLLFWIGLPVISPTLAAILFAGALRERLQRRGAEESASSTTVGEGAYRGTEVSVPSRATLSFAWAKRALAGSPALLGAYGVLSALASGRTDAGVRAFTQTCGHVFSQLPVQMVQSEGHYLCTVAARGHAWLVRPERLGVRAGEIILVNRQLAVANAFEDLLHTRWPRFGHLCRAVYDRLGLPVSRVIRWRVLADVIYLAMKPAEWCFYAALLALDPGDPEARIARMYRP